MGELFQQFLNRAQRGYGQVDKNLFGGLLPGGAARQKPEQPKYKQDLGLPSFNAAPVVSTDNLKQDINKLTRPWAGKPGQFADKGSFQNGLDAINKAGASIMGFLGGNANDIELVRQFYTKNPQVANQYDLPVNLFVRYMSGIGAQELSVSQEQGRRILKSIEERRRDLPEHIDWVEKNMTPAVAASYKRDVAKGMIPVYSFAPDNKEVGNSLGRFWAAPQGDGSFVIDEDFNFGYAPSSKGGDDKRAKMLSPFVASRLSINPMEQANRLVTSGHGTPFKYRLKVHPDGRVTSVDVP